MIEHIVWDMDGTLIDTTSVVPKALQQTVAELTGETVSTQQIVSAYSLGPADVILAGFAGRELKPREVEIYYDILLESSVSAYDGVPEVLDSLRSRKLPVAVFTGASARAAEILCGSAAIVVDVIVGSDEVGAPKPSPDGLLLTAQRLRTATEHMAYVGDSPNDVLAAHRAGCTAVAAGWGHLFDPGRAADVVLWRPNDVLALLGSDPALLATSP